MFMCCVCVSGRLRSGRGQSAHVFVRLVQSAALLHPRYHLFALLEPDSLLPAETRPPGLAGASVWRETRGGGVTD